MKENINDYKKYLINKVGYFRNKAGLSARALSLMVGKSTSYISKFEMGEINLPSELLFDIISACGVTLEEFFYENEQDYEKNKLLFQKFKKLSDENKDLIMRLMDNLK